MSLEPYTPLNVTLLNLLALPSANALVLVYDPDVVGAENQLRWVSISQLSAIANVFLTVGDPEGVLMANGPALAVSALGGVWSRPEAAPGNTGWFAVIAEP